MNNYCVDLNLNISLLKKDFVLPKHRHTKHSIDILNAEVIDFFEQRNLFISLIEIFYSPPFFESKIHADGILGDYTKINFIYGGMNGVMSWYNSDRIEKSTSINSIGTAHTLFDKNEVDLIFQKNIKQSLIQVGIPHSVKNFQDKRWAVCLVYKDKKTKKRLSMAESVRIFKDVIENHDEQ
jgi:hypothetical protein